MSETGDPTTPSRTSKRNAPRINYNELASGESFSDAGLFRPPLASARGKKRRVGGDVHDLTTSFSGLGTPPKRGRQRQSLGGAGRGGGRGGGRRAAQEQDTLTEDKGLIGAVKSGKRMAESVDEWIDRYEENYPVALTELYQFFISISGCKGVLTPQMTNTMEYAEIIRRMTEDFGEESVDYPLVQTGYMYKKFRTNLHTILHTLINKCKSSLMFDNRLMDSVIQLLTGLTDSQVRAFRHTATFCAMKISSALVDVVIDLVSVKEKNAMQIEAEKIRITQNSTGTEKLDVLTQKKTEIEEKTDEVRQMLQYLFRSVFVHRYRDALADIRSICITELGNWMLVYPEHFLEDSFLKYIGWTLYDKVPDVRRKCILALMPLYEKAGVLTKLELFTIKFKERIVSMVMDVTNDVGVETCHLLRSIYTVFPTLLTVQDCIPIYELVYANNRSLAIAAGQFLNAKVFQNAKKPTKSVNQTNAGLIKDLIQFYIEGDCHDHITYLVDALIDTNPIIKDWTTMVDMLLSNTLSEEVETDLIELLTCAVKQTTTGESPVGRQTTKRSAPNTKESRDQLDERIRFTETLIPALSQLLSRFVADREKVVNLVTLPTYFHLDLYLAGRMQNHLTDLMQNLEIVVDKHVDDEVLQGVAYVFHVLSQHQTVGPQTEADRMKLIDGMALQLRRAATRLLNGEQMDEEDETALLCSVRRISAFSSYVDLRKWELWDLTLKVVSNYDNPETGGEVCERAIQILFNQINYDLLRYIKETDAARPEALKKLKKRRDQLMRNLEKAIKQRATGVEQAYLAFCDMHILFGSYLDDAHPNMNMDQLLLNPDKKMITAIQEFVKSNAFTDTDTSNLDQQQQIELMHKKRMLVAQYCKLVMHGALPISQAYIVLEFYVSHYAEFGDIFKNMLLKCRDIDYVATARAMLQALKYIFTGLTLENDDGVDSLSEPFGNLRDLAKRFANLIGNDYKKNRFAVAVFHKESIEFAFDDFRHDSQTAPKEAPKNLLFLEVAIEFCSKLLMQDKTVILNLLNKVYPAGVTGDGDWAPYSLYRNALTERSKDDDVSSVHSFATSVSSMRSFVPSAKRSKN